MNVQGKNSDFNHSGERYHIQTEGWCEKERLIVTQVFHDGKMIFKKKHKCKNSLNDQEMERAHQAAWTEFQELLI